MKLLNHFTLKKRKVELVVISDVHLGTYGCHANELLQYLKSINPKTLVLNGDIIDIDAKKGSINVRLTSAQLKARRKNWKEKKSSFGSGTIWKYAQTVGPAYLGAPTHPGKKKEVKEYSKI